MKDLSGLRIGGSYWLLLPVTSSSGLVETLPSLRSALRLFAQAFGRCHGSDPDPSQSLICERAPPPGASIKSNSEACDGPPSVETRNLCCLQPQYSRGGGFRLFNTQSGFFYEQNKHRWDL